MQITKSYNQPDFTSIYRLSNADKQAVERFEQLVVKPYLKICKNPICFFSGENPFEEATKKTVEEYANQNNFPLDWLWQNIKLHLKNAPDTEQTDLWVFTGTKDLETLKNFMQKVNKTQTSIPNKLKNIFLACKSHNNAIPKHLQPLTNLLNTNTKLNEQFSEMCNEHGFTEFNNMYELTKKLFTE